jgi:hypothetical protein
MHCIVFFDYSVFIDFIANFINRYIISKIFFNQKIMFQVLDKLIDEKKQEIVIVKMDITTYENLVNKDIEFESLK